jgi:hypothetical protein
MPEHVVILKTGRIHELELACNALKDSGIPHFRQDENISGLKTAMYTPAMGPGTFWNLLVPISEKSNADKILSELPIEVTEKPGIWHFSANKKAKKVWRILTIAILSITVLKFIVEFMRS